MMTDRADSPAPDAGPPESRRAASWMGQFVFGEETVRRIRDTAPLLAPLVALTLVNAAVAMAMRQPLMRGLAASPEGLRRALDTAFWLLAVFYPVLALAKVLVLAAGAWAVLTLLGQDGGFRTLLSLLSYGELLLQLNGVFSALVLNLQGVGRIQQASDLLVPWGIDMLVPVHSRVALAAVQAATIFHVLWFVFLVVALPRVTRSTRGGAAATAGSLWAGMIIFNVLRTLVAG
jgi:hypothetical protein